MKPEQGMQRMERYREIAASIQPSELRELDYVWEGQNLEKEPGIRLPRVNWDYTARRVIVLEQPRDPDEPVWPRWRPRLAWNFARGFLHADVAVVRPPGSGHLR